MTRLSQLMMILTPQQAAFICYLEVHFPLPEQPTPPKEGFFLCRKRDLEGTAFKETNSYLVSRLARKGYLITSRTAPHAGMGQTRWIRINYALINKTLEVAFPPIINVEHQNYEG